MCIKSGGGGHILALQPCVASTCSDWAWLFHKVCRLSLDGADIEKSGLCANQDATHVSRARVDSLRCVPVCIVCCTHPRDTHLREHTR